MLSCWNGSPRLRPTFAGLRATIDALLLADRKGDYIEFSLDSNRMSALFEATSGPTTSTPGLMDISPLLPKRHSHNMAEKEECKLLLPNEASSDDCQRMTSNSNVSPRLSPRRWSSIRQSPQSSPRHCSPADSLSLRCQSPKKDRTSERRSRSPILLFPGRHSPADSSSPQSHSPFHASNSQTLEERAARHRPVSLFLTRGEERNKAEDRYVKEPTKMSNLNQATNHSLTHLTTAGGVAQLLQLRRGSEGTLNMNSDGYVSFVGMDYIRDRRAVPPPAEIQITVTEDL